MTLITQGKTNWKFLLIVFILATIVGGGTLVWQYWWAPKENAKLSETEIPSLKINQFYLDNVIGFPIYSKAVLISTEFIPPCEEPIWLSYCNVKVYTWQMVSDYQQIDNWFLKEANKAGWDCHFGDKTSIKTTEGSWQTECNKNNLTYGVKLSAEKGITKVTIFVPQ